MKHSLNTPPSPSDSSPNARPDAVFVLPLPAQPPFTPPPNYVSFRLWKDRWELLTMPGLLYGFFFLNHDTELLWISATLWLIAYPLGALWMMWRISDRHPQPDKWSSIAILICGSAPFWLFIAVILAHPPRHALVLLFPVIYAPGVWALFAARGDWALRGRHPRLIKSAAVVSAVWALFWTSWSLFFLNNPGDDRRFALTFVAIGLTLAVVAIALTFGLFRAAAEVRQTA